MSEVEELARSLLYEGYALYPYTTTNAKNATPTPFGIVYPPAYAGGLATAFDHLQIESVLEYGPEATLEGKVIFLVPSGEDYRAKEQAITIEHTPVELLESNPGVVPISISDEQGNPRLKGHVRMQVRRLAPGQARVSLRIDNQTEVSPDQQKSLDRPRALLHSFISTHPILRVDGGRFISPLESTDPRVAGCRNINSWPVLATEGDDAILGAAIMLPEHPQIAPESKVNFFDNTEIEEALVLHAQTLTDDMLEEIKQADPAVQQMIACARQVTPEELLKMHGRLQMRDAGQQILGDTPAEAPFAERFGSAFQAAAGVHDPYAQFLEPAPQPVLDPDMPVYEGLAPMATGRFSGSFQATPPEAPSGYEDLPGLAEIEADGRHFQRGDKVLLRLLMSDRQDAIDHMLSGKTATIERILTDYDGTVHLGVTIDGDPGQELLRESNRFMFFFLNEVEVLPR